MCMFIVINTVLLFTAQDVCLKQDWQDFTNTSQRFYSTSQTINGEDYTKSCLALQACHQPKVQGQACIKFLNNNFELFNDINSVKLMKTDQKTCNYCPNGDNCVSNGRINTFTTELSAPRVTSHFVDIMKANAFKPLHTSRVLCQDIVPSVTCTSITTIGLTYVTSDRELGISKCKVQINTIEKHESLSNRTVDQAINPLCFIDHSIRLAASRFKEIVNRRKCPCGKKKHQISYVFQIW